MNTIWLKISGLVVLIVAGIVLFSFLTSGKDSGPKQAEQPAKNIYEQWDKDDKELMAEPQYKEPPAPAPSAQQPVQPSSPVAPAQPVEQPKPQFKELSPEDEIEAEKLWIWVENQRKMGRLPVMGYGQMVKGCRDIIQRWPESKYAFFAKRALADLPERYREMYNITKEEIDLGNLK
jgi:type IV secretory pathway VirB10-like protein